MNWRHIGIVWRKEILDTARDKRTLVAGILAPLLIMPLLTFGSRALIESTQRRAEEERTPITILGAAGAPRLVALIGQSGAFADVRPADAAGALKSGAVKLVIRIPPDFEREAFAGKRPATLAVEYEAREMTSPIALEKLRRVLDAYQTMAQAARLGLSDPGILETVRLAEKNTSTPREMGGMLLGFFLPFTLAIWGIMGGMYTAIDAVAGEKERRTLEMLVVTPPSRASLAAGKCLAVFTMSSLTMMLALTGTYLSFHYGVQLVGGAGDLRVSLDLGSVGLVLLAALPYLAMLAGLEVSLSSLGRSFKETQNYFTILTFAVMLPGMALVTVGSRFPGWVYAVPIANAIALFKNIFTDNWRWGDFVLCGLVNLAACAGTVTLAQRLLAEDSLMFKS